MNNWENDIRNKHELMRNIYHGTVPHDIFEWIKKIIWEKRRQQKQSATKHLVGHLTEEYFIKNRPSRSGERFIPDDNFVKYESFISNCCLTKPLDDLWINNQYLDEDREIIIDTSWVNFQKKYEFNPPHTHSGLFSWIIFVQIPYNLEDEENYFLPEHLTQTSKLNFLFSKPIFHGGRGDIANIIVNVDKSYEGKILVFPAELMHSVNPFYTSDDYRITVSGNVIFKVTN